MNKWKLDQSGIDLIKRFEGLCLNAYQDKAGVWTIGYGCTRYRDGSRVKKGDKLVNEACATDLLLVKLVDFENEVNALVKYPQTQNRYTATVSFHYNTGALSSSTLLKKYNAGDIIGASLEFLKWNKITDPVTKQKVVLDDLTKRRAIEQKLFLKP